MVYVYFSISSFNWVKNVKFAVEQVMKAQRGSRGIAILSVTSALNEGESVTPRPVPPTPGQETVLVVKGGGWAPGPV